MVGKLNRLASLPSLETDIFGSIVEPRLGQSTDYVTMMNEEADGR